MTVVAEGAELPAEVDVLGSLDCDLVQGSVFSPPIAARPSAAGGRLDRARGVPHTAKRNRL
ncbi:hypothetical protein QMZ05_23580 [Bradyrhizobium sp. INPA03-11B]|uniref:hypothetical protein n=1 Tax=Bradyrhizobium sp. INPA03-11B TaxID=418598 RepID=UPI00338FFC90